LLFLKFELLIQKINLRLPRILRITKVGLLTSIISVVLATSVSIIYASNDLSNLGRWVGREGNNGLVPELISTANDIVLGHTEENEGSSNSYVIKGSLIVLANNLVVETYENTDQVSGTKYIASTLEDAGVIEPVYASPTGYRSFQPVQKIWMVMRNIALAFVIIIGLILAVMVLLRVRQGQGYVTILNSLPKLILTVILILASYSISGFLVDIGNVAEKVIISIFFNKNFIDSTFYGLNKGVADPAYPHNMFYDDKFHISEGENKDYNEDYSKDFNLFRLLSRFTEFETWGEVPCNGVEKPDWHYAYNDDSNICPLSVTDIIRTPTNIGFLDRGVKIGDMAPDAARELLNLIIAIMIISGIFKIFFSLVSSFAKMILYTIFAPFAFLLYPISSGAITSWLRYFLSASLLFPAAFLMMFLAAIIMGDASSPWLTVESGNEIAGIAPDLLTYSTAVDADGNVPFLTRIVSVVIVLMIPTLPEYLMEVLKAPENLMARGAKERMQKVASKIPFVGGMVSNMF